jgi:mono/diheme cytochrome c family protein
MRYALRKITLISLIFAANGAGAAYAYADAGAGSQIAQRWCSSCHIIGETQTGSVPQGPPSFRTIAKSGMTAEQLRAFLSHPHGSMPDLALSRTEIDDLTAYIQSLR